MSALEIAEANEQRKNEWQLKSSFIGYCIDIPKNPSTFPEQSRQLCESKVDLICSGSSRIVSG